jgi:hypothetical protein
MKKTVVAILALSLALILNSSGFAADRSAEKAKAKAEAEKTVQELAKRQAGQKATDLLNSKEWIIYLYPSGVSLGKKLPVVSDVLTFKGGKVSSKVFSAKGFAESNYTLTVYDVNLVVWETMQATEQEDLAFWRGELRGADLTGVMNMHTAKGVIEEYSFGMNAPAPAHKVEAAVKKR